jgi:hypothetical protein
MPRFGGFGELPARQDRVCGCTMVEDEAVPEVDYEDIAVLFGFVWLVY